MKEFFKDIFNYHHFNRLFIDLIMLNREKIHDESYNLFCHVLNAHQVWNSRILNQPSFGVREIHLPEDLKKIDSGNFRDTMFILEQTDLEKNVSYKNTKGDQFSNPVKDILFHINNHSTHHKAQLSATLRSIGITPLTTDFIFYKRMQ